MSHHLLQKELESYLWDAATLLRGLIDASDYSSTSSRCSSSSVSRMSGMRTTAKPSRTPRTKAMRQPPPTTVSRFPKALIGKAPAMPHAMSAGPC
ncbi:hypothetical protein KT71_002340 [Congregibacter litoralis KT71]|uniref:Uncharacterized protein n=1 Tax=Congregibacter litoralis KT71 TaxID=314285 RepID=V7HV25_9GAMM|nr:hypothetical protein KT71_002340 [Congregibacter litoralis KT71]